MQKLISGLSLEQAKAMMAELATIKAGTRRGPGESDEHAKTADAFGHFMLSFDPECYGVVSGKYLWFLSRQNKMQGIAAVMMVPAAELPDSCRNFTLLAAERYVKLFLSSTRGGVDLSPLNPADLVEAGYCSAIVNMSWRMFPPAMDGGVKAGYGAVLLPDGHIIVKVSSEGHGLQVLKLATIEELYAK